MSAMQQVPQQAASSFSMGEPQFATVTFIGEDNVQGSTFRVPLNPATTVSRLAKDAMKRLVLSRPSEGRHRELPAIAVTEVYVGGNGAQPKAEIFAQDVVQHVVLVREEVVYMKLRAAPNSTAPSRLPTPPPPPSHVEAAQGNAPECPSRSAAAATTGSQTLPASTNSTAAAVTQAAASTEVATCRGRHSTAAAPTTQETRPPAASVSQSKRPGWGPDAYDHFDDNYVSTPGKRARATKRNTAADSHGPKRTKTDMTSKGSTEQSGATEREAAARLAQENERGLRWGPEASKSFADNYVSSPEKLARLARRQRRAAKESAGAQAASAPSKPTPAAHVSRELTYPADLPDSGRTTVGHVVEREVITVEEEPTAQPPVPELPKGWGAESLRFFDPSTYCDDPKKARLMPNMDFSRPTRQRRPASP